MAAKSVALIALACGACGRLGFSGNGDGDGGGSGALPGARSILALDKFIPQESLVDFPLLVVLDDTRAQRSLIRADAGDVMFRDGNGTILAHEIEQVGTPGGAPLLAWVRVPVFDGTNDAIEVSYGGDPVAAPGPVWSSNYVAVWHLGDTSDTIVDAAGIHDGVAIGSQPDPAGKIGTGRAFNADLGEYIRVPTGNMVALSAITMGGWIRPLRHSPSTTGFHAIVTREHGTGNSDDFYIGVSNGDVVCVLLATDTTFDSISGPPAVYGSWMHIAATWGAGTARLYLDGVEVGTKAIPGTTLHTEDYPIFLGGNRNNLNGSSPVDVADDDYTDGPLDEVRVEGVERSGAWIAADVASMLDRIITYGPPTML